MIVSRYTNARTSPNAATIGCTRGIGFQFVPFVLVVL